MPARPLAVLLLIAGYAACAIGIVWAPALSWPFGHAYREPWELFLGIGAYSAAMAIGVVRLQPKSAAKPWPSGPLVALALHLAMLATLPIQAVVRGLGWNPYAEFGIWGFIAILLGWLAAIPAVRTMRRGRLLLVVAVVGLVVFATICAIELGKLE